MATKGLHKTRSWKEINLLVTNLRTNQTRFNSYLVEISDWTMACDTCQTGYFYWSTFCTIFDFKFQAKADC
jgi:hypothetical protein